MTSEEKAKMIKTLEEKWGYPVTEVAELLRSLNLKGENENYLLEQRINRILREIGIKANLRGFYYLQEAIIRNYNGFKISKALTTKLYPSLAEEYGATAYGVERSINHAIKSAFICNNTEALQKYFGKTIAERGKLSNGQFIALITDYLKMQDRNKNP